MKKSFIIGITLLVSLFIVVACAELQQIGYSVATQAATKSVPLSETDVIAGLKQALRVGTDTAVKNLAAINGYYRDALVKITMPPEAQTILTNINKLPGGQKLVSDLELRINRSAEDAAKEAAPIFANAITSMSIADAWGILRGADTAATAYLRKSTYQSLLSLYKPKIKSSIDKPLVAGISTSQSWNTLTSKWNSVANSPVGALSSLKPVNTQLDDYLTRKALDGLFLKVAEEEKSIRKDPVARVTDLLKRVFSSK